MAPKAGFMTAKAVRFLRGARAHETDWGTQRTLSPPSRPAPTEWVGEGMSGHARGEQRG